MVAIGEVDAANCAIGLAASACQMPRISDVLQQVQHRLFDLGADLATPMTEAQQGGSAPAVRRIDAEDITAIERAIDAAEAKTPPLKQFVLPGGTELAARLHQARAAARQAERACITLQSAEPANEFVVVYLNRLSDLLFALARQANHEAGAQDVPWAPRR